MKATRREGVPPTDVLELWEEKILKETEYTGFDGNKDVGFPLKWLGSWGQKLEYIAIAEEDRLWQQLTLWTIVMLNFSSGPRDNGSEWARGSMKILQGFELWMNKDFRSRRNASITA